MVAEIIKNEKENSKYEKVELLTLNLKPFFLKRERLSLGERGEFEFDLLILV